MRCAGQYVTETANARRIQPCPGDAVELITFQATTKRPITAFTLPLCIVHQRLWREAAPKHGMQELEQHYVEKHTRKRV